MNDNEMRTGHSMRRFARLTALTLFPLLLAQTGHAQQDSPEPCGPLRPPGQYGPFDYRKDADKLQIVHEHHFSPQVEMLIRGQEGPIGGDLDYVLRAFPNHARALIAMADLGVKDKTVQPRGAHYQVECYFERAIRFAPDDQVVRMLYVTYLTRLARTQEARTQLRAAEGLAGDNPLTYYNIGLLYFDLKDYDNALTFAHKARALGAQQTGLQQKLTQAGRWAEPAPEAASAPASSVASDAR
ncbi:ABC transporter permease [Pelomonas sp. KK5]|uniref:tetratricopeptide repeat protein n=1 Tax=Pelomonas sp. KK5 TaxID=1855730 RepID=UPI00117EA823|nr:ABC transporter permease [Pelomonas sp. KK5]